MPNSCLPLIDKKLAYSNKDNISYDTIYACMVFDACQGLYKFL